jgi:hypothetical protein
MVTFAPPCFIAGLCCRNLGYEFLVANIIERFEELTVGGVDAGEGHDIKLFLLGVGYKFACFMLR